MNAKWIALIAAAVLSAPLTAGALAHEDDRRDGGRDDRRYTERDDRRDSGRDQREWERDRERSRERPYTVRFDIDGSRRHVAETRENADRLVEWFGKLGVDAHLDSGREVHYKLRGTGRREFYTHENAKECAAKLRRLGFNVQIVE